MDRNHFLWINNDYSYQLSVAGETLAHGVAANTPTA